MLYILIAVAVAIVVAVGLFFEDRTDGSKKEKIMPSVFAGLFVGAITFGLMMFAEVFVPDFEFEDVSKETHELVSIDGQTICCNDGEIYVWYDSQIHKFDISSCDKYETGDKNQITLVTERCLTGSLQWWLKLDWKRQYNIYTLKE